jgi:hypothetical protein
METCKVELINYFDVWAGEEKGTWEVNNLCSEGMIELPEDFTDDQLLKALKEKEFLKKHVRKNMLVFEYLFDFGVEIRQRKNDYPICRVEYR